ncbi:hypothetical protein BGX38DRAFT_1159452 [Terfezia claveryi]|nr:hypothetical protein BGX38DRAFT_1159452 [Terfezia claveryi]
MVMVLEASHRLLMPSTQKPLEDCYGFPPSPSVLRQTAMAMRMPASPSLSPSTPSPSPTPSLRPTHKHQYLLHDSEPQVIEGGSNLAEYLARNPGMKRLYSTHGSIKRPACVSCNESRKKCDLERPCKRCVKQKLHCIERPPRAKKRKIEHEFPIISLPHSPPPLDITQYGLPSPVSERQSETIVGTPMELDIASMPMAHSVDERPPRALYNTPLSPPDSSEKEVCGKQAICTFDAGIHNHQDVADIEVPVDVFEVPSPMGSYLDGISSTLSAAPVFGLEGSDSTLKSILLEELERDLSLEGENLDISQASSLLRSTDGMAEVNEDMKSAHQSMDVDVFSEGMRFDLPVVGALMEYPLTDQELKDILEWKGFDLEMTDTQIDGMGGFSTYADAPGAAFSTGVDAFGWNDDWSI